MSEEDVEFDYVGAYRELFNDIKRTTTPTRGVLQPQDAPAIDAKIKVIHDRAVADAVKLAFSFGMADIPRLAQSIHMYLGHFPQTHPARMGALADKGLQLTLVSKDDPAVTLRRVYDLVKTMDMEMHRSEITR